MVPKNPLVTGAGKRNMSLPKPSLPKATLHTPVKTVEDMMSANTVGGIFSG